MTTAAAAAAAAAAEEEVYVLDVSAEDDATRAEKIKVSQAGPALLRCNNKLYKLDAEHVKTFSLRALYKVNAQDDAMYIMYHDKAFTTEAVLKYNMDVMNETWCDLWKP